MDAITRFTLSNGLRVVHSFDPSTRSVALGVLYLAGARDESPEYTGVAHLMEHLMFGGSEHNQHFDVALESAGATVNAWTSSDFTYYYSEIPAVNAATLFWAESDRMTRLCLDNSRLEVQRSVVIEEFSQTCLNKPYGRMGHILRSLLYREHHYRWPAIGLSPDHVRAITMEDVVDFYRKRYAPSNAILSVAGNITAERVRDLAEKWFGGLDTRPKPVRELIVEPEPHTERRLSVSGPEPQTRIVIAVPMCGVADAGYPAADIITDILASGASSRFYRHLTLGHPAVADADASVSGLQQSGYLMLNARLGAGGAEVVTEAEHALWDEARALALAPPARQELQRALNRFESRMIFRRMVPAEVARDMAMAEAEGRVPEEILARYRSLTPEDIQIAAEKLFQPHRRCVICWESAPV